MDSMEKLKELFKSGIPFAARAGIEAARMEKDGITLKMPLDPNRNHIGTMYAGALFTLAEMMGGAVAMVYFMEHGLVPIVKGLNIKFVKPAKTDITTTWHMENDEVEHVVADCKEHGKSEYTINLELEDKDGVVVAVSEGFYQVRGSWKR
ncbi:MAG: YiiD C-terminal domain-containing protein [bacterium]